MENKNNIIGTGPISNRKEVQTDKSIPENIYIPDRSHSWLSTGTSGKRGEG